MFLNRSDTAFLLQNLDLDDKLRSKLTAISSDGSIDEDLADALRELCSDKYDSEGLDENYQPTKVGYELEQLIDKLYVD